MHMTVATSFSIEDWLSTNTTLCRRMDAFLSHAACRENQLHSQGQSGDLRCHGCGGLNDQSVEVRDPLTFYLAYPCYDESEADPIDESEIKERSEEVETSRHGETLEPQSEQIDLSALDDLELDLNADTLAALANGNFDFYRELESLLSSGADSDEAPEQIEASFRRTTQQKKPQRYAVFMGRCQRCGGYVDNTREGKDDDVHRCLACGWRTSPAYEWNRSHPELAGWRG